MSETFTNILTKIGQQKKAQAEATGVALNITTFKVGDGNGNYYEPNENQTTLINVKYSGNFVAGTQSQIVVNPSNLNEVLYKCFIPADVGGFTIRELGLFDDDNDLILICKLPAQDKFALASGLYQPLTFTPKIIYTNPQTQAVLTPTSQIIPTKSEVATLIESALSENIQNTTYVLPIKNTDGIISLEIDNSLKVLNNKLSAVEQLTKFCMNSGNVDALGIADLLYAPGSGTVKATWIQPTLTSNGIWGVDPVSVRTSSTYGSYNGYFALDNDNSLVWICNGTTGYLEICILEEIELVSVTITNNTAGYGNPTAGSIQISNDYSNWDTVNFTAPGTAGSSLTVDLSNISNYKFIRINVSAINAGQNLYIQNVQINALKTVSVSTATACYFKVGGSYPFLTLTYADRSQEILTSLETIQGLTANGTYTILKEKNSSNAVAILSTKVNQGKIFPNSPTEGDYFCCTATDLKTYKYISNVWVETQYITLGTLTVAGGVITSVATNSYNQNRYDMNVNSFLQNLSNNGWTKLPSGLILQWGTIGTYGPSLVNTPQVVTFPITFPNACLCVINTTLSNYGSSTAIAYVSLQSWCVSSATFEATVQGRSWFAIGY